MPFSENGMQTADGSSGEYPGILGAKRPISSLGVTEQGAPKRARGAEKRNASRWGTPDDVETTDAAEVFAGVGAPYGDNSGAGSPESLFNTRKPSPSEPLENAPTTFHKKKIWGRGFNYEGWEEIYKESLEKFFQVGWEKGLAFAEARQTAGGIAAIALADLGAEGIPLEAKTKIQPREDDTICDKCHGLHLSCILGHDVTIDDMKHFQEHSASHFDLGYIYRPSHLLCRMCSFLRDCLSIEHLQLNDNPSKPKLVRSSASEFFGVRNRKEFLNAPCLVFAPKKEDGQGCILPAASSSHRQGTIVGRKLEPDKIGYSIFSHWLSFCKERHEKICERPRGANDTRSFSLKVIDCATRKILSLPLGGKEDYVTLSYVWGLSTDTSGNKEDSTELPESVPKVIEDAMIVVMQLGLRFLWVDRYCIPQEDDKEKHSQLRNMGTIYSNSVLTIIAAAGEGPDHGLPGVSSTLRLPQPSIRWGSDELVYCLSRGGRREIQSSKWNSRGWTYQEGLLARRRLIFTERQVYFQCQAMHQNESITTQLDSVRVKNVFPLSIDFGFYFPTFQDLQRSPTSFQSRVQEFIRREFTFDSDVLAAFQGILALFETSKAPISHLCGIPLFSFYQNARKQIVHEIPAAHILAVGLSWRFDIPMVRRPEFPSWSWLGWKPSPAKPRPDESGSESCFRVIAVHSDREDYVPIMRDDCSIAAILEFEGSGGSRHNWDKDTMDRLGEHTVAAAGKPPGFLILTGWAFEVTVERGAAGETMWKFDHGLGLVNGLPLPGAVEDAAGPEHPSGQKLWGFILGIEEVIEASGPRAAYARFYGGGVLILIVRELDDGAKYERVDCTLCSRMGPFFILGPAEAMIGERNLIRKEIKLG